jgi:autotransporter translocation and assembly factor TamB
LDWTLGIDDLSLITASLVGDLRAQGQVRGPSQTARLEASAVGNIGTPTIQRQQINLSVNAIGFPRSQSGEFSAQGRFDGAPLSLDGELTRLQDGLKATVERGTWKSLDARADVTIRESGDISGNAMLRLSRLNDIASVIGEPIEGDVQAEIIFRRRDGETSADITARAQTIRYADAALRTIDANADLTVQDNGSSIRIDARASDSLSRRSPSAMRPSTAGLMSPSTILACAHGERACLAAARFAGDAKAEINGRTDAMNIRFDWTRSTMPAIQDKFRPPQDSICPASNSWSARCKRVPGQTVTLEQPFTLAFGPRLLSIACS